MRLSKSGGGRNGFLFYLKYSTVCPRFSPEVKMKFTSLLLKYCLSVLLLFSIVAPGLSGLAQDILTSTSLQNGSSVFVFRESRSKKQVKAFYSRPGARSKINAKHAARRRSAGVNNTAVARKTVKPAAPAAAKTRGLGRTPAGGKLKQSEILITEARVLLDKNEIEAAIGKFEEALAKDPRNQEAQSGLSEAYLAKGNAIGGQNAEFAVASYETAIKHNEKNAAAFVKLAEIFEDQARLDKAIWNYEKALALDPERAGLNVALADLYLQNGDLARAESFLQAATAAGPASVETDFLRGLIHLKRNENQEAMALFDRVIAREPNHLLAHYYQAELFDRADQKKEAIAAYEKTLQLDPQFTPAWNDLGAVSYNQGNYEKAVAAYREAVKQDQTDAPAHAGLAASYRELERYPEANSEYRIAAETIKDDADLYNEWGYSQGQAGEWDGAVASLETARAIEPDAISHSNLGWAYYNGAQKDLKTENKAGADDKLKKGKIVLEKAVEISPRFGPAYLNLGVTNTGLGDFAAAVAALATAVELNPQWIAALNELGVAYRHLNQLKDAIAQFERAVSLDDKFAVGLFNLSEAYYKNGNKKEGKKAQDKLKQLDPVLARELENKIKEKLIDETKRKIKNKIPGLPF